MWICKRKVFADPSSIALILCTQDIVTNHMNRATRPFTYNFDSCMTQRENSVTDSVDSHEYDGNSRRMRSKLNNAANWTNFIHDELTENLICEYTLISGTFTIKALNTYGLGLFSSNREGTIRHFHFDGLGSTAHLSDTSQTVTDSYTYNAFGVPYTPTGSSVNPYRYVGQWGYYDDGARGSSSQMLLLGVRYYWPKYGRFVTWDPAHALLSSYRYLIGPVTSSADPQGLDEKWHYGKPRRVVFSGIDLQYNYGAYCGSTRIQNPARAVLPQDCVDSCCRTHDRCLEAHYGSSYSAREAHACCDSALSKCLEWVKRSRCCDRSERPDECWKIRWLAHEAFGLVRVWSEDTMHYRVSCIDEVSWPAAVRSHWGNPSCYRPEGEGSDK
ncbi:MAG: hypothetical protein M3R13_07840 [Armatimonadota bacterium]|nr:hypothetical protein [Armatimonadota bacterium]